MPNIGDLTIQIDAQVAKAESALDSLSRKMSQLAASMSALSERAGNLFINIGISQKSGTEFQKDLENLLTKYTKNALDRFQTPPSSKVQDSIVEFLKTSETDIKKAEGELFKGGRVTALAKAFGGDKEAMKASMRDLASAYRTELDQMKADFGKTGTTAIKIPVTFRIDDSQLQAALNNAVKGLSGIKLKSEDIDLGAFEEFANSSDTLEQVVRSINDLATVQPDATKNLGTALKNLKVASDALKELDVSALTEDLQSKLGNFSTMATAIGSIPVANADNIASYKKVFSNLKPVLKSVIDLDLANFPANTLITVNAQRLNALSGMATALSGIQSVTNNDAIKSLAGAFKNLLPITNLLPQINFDAITENVHDRLIEVVLMSEELKKVKPLDSEHNLAGMKAAMGNLKGAMHELSGTRFDGVSEEILEKIRIIVRIAKSISKVEPVSKENLKALSDALTIMREVFDTISQFKFGNLSGTGGLKEIKKLPQVAESINAIQPVDPANLKTFANAAPYLRTVLDALDGAKFTTVTDTKLSAIHSLNRLADSLSGFAPVDTDNLQRLQEMVSAISATFSAVNSLVLDQATIDKVASMRDFVDIFGSFAQTMSVIVGSIPNVDAFTDFVLSLQTAFDALATISIPDVLRTTMPEIIDIIGQLGYSLQGFPTGISFNSIGTMLRGLAQVGTFISSADFTRLPQFGQAVAQMLAEIANAPALDRNVINSLESMGRFAEGMGTYARAQQMQNPTQGQDQSHTEEAIRQTRTLHSGFISLASAIRRTMNFIHRLSNYVNRLAGAFKQLGNTILRSLQIPFRFFGKMGSGIKTTIGWVGKMAQSFKSFGSTANNSLRQHLSYLTRIVMRYMSIWKLVGFLKDGIGRAMDQVETYHYFETAFDKIAGDANKQLVAELNTSIRETNALGDGVVELIDEVDDAKKAFNKVADKVSTTPLAEVAQATAPEPKAGSLPKIVKPKVGAFDRLQQAKQITASLEDTSKKYEDTSKKILKTNEKLSEIKEPKIDVFGRYQQARQIAKGMEDTTKKYAETGKKIVETNKKIADNTKETLEASKKNVVEIISEQAEIYKQRLDEIQDYTDKFKQSASELNTELSGVTYNKNGYGTYDINTPNLGLDSDMVMGYQAQYAQIANGIGMMGKEATITSNALTMLAGDWSSLRNINFETSFEKMANALAGQARSVRSLGIDITQAKLAEVAANLGIGTSIAKMTQAEKAQLRMIAIIEQSEVAWGDLAKTLDTPANQFRMLQQNVKTLSRTIGNLFIPMLHAVLPYINGLVIALQQLFQWIANVTGIADLIGTSGSAVGGMSDETADLLDGMQEDMAEAEEQAKSLKATILGFDELNVLNGKESETSTRGVGLTDAEQDLLSLGLSDKYEEMLKKWQEEYDKLKSKAQEVAKGIMDAFSKLYDMFMNHDWNGIGEYVGGAINRLVQRIRDYFNWDNLGPRITEFMTGLTESINSIVRNINFENIGRMLGDGLNVLTNTLLLWFRGIDWVSLGKSFADGFNGLLYSVDWNALGALLGAYIQSWIGRIYGFVTEFDWRALGIALGMAFMGMINEINWEQLGSTIAQGLNGLSDTIRGFTDMVNWKDLGDKLDAAFRKFVEDVDFEDIFGSIKGAFMGALDTLEAVLSDFSTWTELAKKFSDGFWSVVGDGIMWTKIGLILGDWWRITWGAFHELVADKEKFHDLGLALLTGLRAAIERAAQGENSPGKVLAELFNGAIETAYAFLFGDPEKNIEPLDWGKVAEAATGNVSDFVTEFDKEGKLPKIFGNIVHGLFTVLGSLISSHSVEELARKFGEQIKAITDEVSFTTAIGEFGELVKQSVGGVISGIFGDAAGEGAQGFIDGFFKVIQANAELINNVKEICKGVVEVITDLVTAIPQLIEQLGKLLEGLGFEQAGKDLQEVGSTLKIKTIENLGKALGALVGISLTASFVTRFATFAQSIMGIGAAASGATATTGMIGNLLGKAGSAMGFESGLGFAGAVGSMALLAGGIDTVTSSIDKLRGGNGVITDYGSAIEGVVMTLGDALHGHEDDIRALWEQYELAGLSAEDFAKIMAEGFANAGVPFEALQQAIYQVEQTSGTADTQVQVLKASLAQYADIAPQAASSASFDPSKVSAEEFLSALNDLNTNGFSELCTWGESGEAAIRDLQGMMYTFDTSSTVGMFQNVVDILERTGQDTTPFLEFLQTRFPNAFTQSVQNVQGSQKSYEGSTKNTAQVTQDANSEITTSTEKTASSVATNFDKMQQKHKEHRASYAATKESIVGDNANIVEDLSNAVEIIDGEFDKSKDSLSDLSGTYKEKTQDSSNSLTKWADENVKQNDKVGKSSGGLKDLLGKNYKELSSNVSTELSSVAQTVEEKGKDISNETKMGYTSYTSKANAKMTEFQTKTLPLTVGAIGSQFDTLGKNIPGKFDNVPGNIADKLKDTPSKISAAFNMTQMQGIGTNIGNAIGGGIASAISGTHIPIPDIYISSWDQVTTGDTTTNLPRFSVNWRAKGGLFNNPSIIGVGEAGSEAVIPLTNDTTMRKIANAITSRMQGLPSFDLSGISRTIQGIAQDIKASITSIASDIHSAVASARMSIPRYAQAGVDTSTGRFAPSAIEGFDSETLMDAVAQGVAMALTQNPQTVEVVVNSTLRTDNERLATAVSRGQARLNQRYNSIWANA